MTRLERHLFERVEGLAALAGTSRNKVMNQLVEIAIELTLEELSPEAVKQVLREGGKAASALDERKTVEFQKSYKEVSA
jgi:hypothetical protein